jgi:two-component system CheB/CheR fusion protein
MEVKDLESISYRINGLAIFETVREPMVVLDSRLRVIMTNRAFYRVFKTDAENTLGRSIYQLGNNQWDIPELHELLENILPSSKTFDGFHVEHTFPEIGHRIFLLNAREIIPESSPPRLILLAFEDITDRVAADRQKEGRTRELERANDKLENFAMSAAHDLQSPLNKIATYVDLLVESFHNRLSDQEKKYVEHLKSQPNKMRLLINDLLMFAQVSSKSFPIEIVSLNAIIQDALNSLSDEIRGANATIRVGTLPTMKGRKFQLRQLFINLLTNALKYRKADTPLVVTIDVQNVQDGCIRLYVKDNGIGFDGQKAEEIFEPLRRLHGREYAGTGLGLAICRRAAEDHGGRICAESTPGGGATFIVSFPVDALVPERSAAQFDGNA